MGTQSIGVLRRQVEEEKERIADRERLRAEVERAREEQSITATPPSPDLGASSPDDGGGGASINALRKQVESARKAEPDVKAFLEAGKASHPDEIDARNEYDVMLDALGTGNNLREASLVAQSHLDAHNRALLPENLNNPERNPFVGQPERNQQAVTGFTEVLKRFSQKVPASNDTMAERIARFEGEAGRREGSPFARQTPRDPLGTAFEAARVPGRIGGAVTSEVIGLERAAAEQLGLPGRAVDPLDISPDTALLRLARGDLGPKDEVGFGAFVNAVKQRESERNFGQNLLLEAGADPLNIVPGVGFTSLGRNVTRGGFKLAPVGISDTIPREIPRQTLRELTPGQIPPSLRPVVAPPGHTRLFRGEFGDFARTADDSRQLGRFFTPDEDLAKFHGENVFSVDVPNSVYREALAEKAEFAKLGETSFGVTLPAKFANQARRVATQRPAVPREVPPATFGPGPLEIPAEIEARRVAKSQHIEAAAPDGPVPPPPEGTPPVVPPGSSGVPPIDNRLLAQAGPGKMANERLDQSLLRFHEAAIENAKREIGTFVTQGNRRLFQQGIGTRSGTSLAARPEDIPSLDRLNVFLHNPSKVASGEMQVPPQFREIYDDLRGGMDWETADRLDFDPEMATVADYFYRGWKPPEGMFPQTGRGNLVSTPAFKKPRNGATYQEMRELGFEPLFWNPYEQLRVARLQGVRYREQMELVEALKSLGDDMIRPHEGGAVQPGWRVPEIGPAFEGKPFAIVDKLSGEPRAMFTRRWIVRDEMANPLESMYGKRPNLGNLHVAGKNIDILKVIDWAVFVPKRFKLFGSFFQQIDFATRAGVGSWHGMVNALTTGHPIEAVKHLALYPKTVTDILQANFRPNFRANLKKQLNSTETLIQGRPGVNLKGISDAGLSILDLTILPTDLDTVVRAVARESGLVRVGKAAPRAVVALEGAMRRGLFEGVYPAAIINDVKNNIAPIVSRTYPSLTDAQMNSVIATLANKRFSTIPASQSVIQNRVVRETLRRVMFSLNESEGLLRQATGTIKGPSKRFWLENWLGAYLFLMTQAEIIHYASTGEFLPLDRFRPLAENIWGGLPIGYNRDFASPTLPISGKGGLDLTLDIVGQMDTVLRVLHPLSFITSRESLPIRAVTNQLTGENFFGNPIDEVGPGGVASRMVQLAQDLFSPIGFGQAGIEALRGQFEDQIPEGLVTATETRLGEKGQFIQGLGINVRAQIMESLDKVSIEMEGVPYNELPTIGKGSTTRRNRVYDRWFNSLHPQHQREIEKRKAKARRERERIRDEFFNLPNRSGGAIGTGIQLPPVDFEALR